MAKIARSAPEDRRHRPAPPGDVDLAPPRQLRAAEEERHAVARDERVDHHHSTPTARRGPPPAQLAPEARGQRGEHLHHRTAASSAGARTRAGASRARGTRPADARARRVQRAAARSRCTTSGSATPRPASTASAKGSRNGPGERRRGRRDATSVPVISQVGAVRSWSPRRARSPARARARVARGVDQREPMPAGCWVREHHGRRRPGLQLARRGVLADVRPRADQEARDRAKRELSLDPGGACIPRAALTSATGALGRRPGRRAPWAQKKRRSRTRAVPGTRRPRRGPRAVAPAVVVPPHPVARL